jgi:hypothetical protein
MKKNIIFILISTALFNACVPKNQQQQVDPASVMQSIDSLMQRNLKSWNSKEPGTMNNLLADNGLFCGTDPGEFWDKQTLLKMWDQMISDSIDYSYSVSKREVKVAPDGKSAIVVEQFILPAFSPDIPERAIYHVVKIGNGWKFDFISWNFIPKNEDLAKLSKAVE